MDHREVLHSENPKAHREYLESKELEFVLVMGQELALGWMQALRSWMVEPEMMGPAEQHQRPMEQPAEKCPWAR